MNWKLLSWNLILVVATGTAAPCFGMDASVMSGVYQSGSTQVDGDSAGGKATISLATRLGFGADVSSPWLFEAAIGSTSYTAPKGVSAPKDETNIRLGGGSRWLFANLSEKIRPYFQARGGLRLGTYAKDTTVGTTTASAQHDVRAVWYAADVGLRMDVSKTYFFELEAPLFSSDIYSEDKASVGGTTDVVVKNVDLYVQSYGKLAEVMIGVGMVL